MTLATLDGRWIGLSSAALFGTMHRLRGRTPGRLKLLHQKGGEQPAGHAGEQAFHQIDLAIVGVVKADHLLKC